MLAPHPDDIEFACGASVHQWGQKGDDIYYAAFSPCNKSLPDGFAVDALFRELEESTRVLKVPKENVRTFDFPVREFPKYRQDILETMVQLKKEIQPDLVVLPNSTDLHQDHIQIHLEGLRAFKHCCLLGYEQPWNNLKATTNFHVAINEDSLMAKWNAIKNYQSQSFRPYFDLEFIKGWARVRGTQIDTLYAEAYELIRWIE